MSDLFTELELESNYCTNCGEGDSDWCDYCNGCRYEPCGTCTCGSEYCVNCGPEDSDWCDECNGCRYNECDTCTCEHEFDVSVHYYVTVTARSVDDITSDMVHDAARRQGYPDEWEPND